MNTQLNVHDTFFDQDAILIHWFEPVFQPANPAGAGAYFAPPVATNIFAVLLWPDNTLHIQSLNNIKAKAYQ